MIFEIKIMVLNNVIMCGIFDKINYESRVFNSGVMLCVIG